MARKLQGFSIFKFSSKRLSKSKFNIKIDIATARRNGELVKLGDSALLEVIRRVTGKQFDKDKYDDLHKQKSRIMKQPSSDENKNELLSILKKIDDMLLIDTLVEVQFQNKTHYQKIYDKGLFINDKEYIRILAGAANLRKQTVFFLQRDYYEQVTDILNCGRNVDDKLNPAKFSAYWGLYNSASHPVSFPKFIVIPDYEYTRMVKMDWIDEHNEISEVEKEVVFNAFDGQGLCSPRLSKIWAKELDLSHTPSTYIIRAPFLKGQVVTFDFHEFANYVARNNMVKDIWGKEVDINDVDLVISQSQFKLWNSYPNQRYYEQKCLENGLGFRISRYSQPFEKIKEYSNTNYMFIQVLDLDEKEIEELCKPTIEYFRDLMGGSREKMLTYLYPDNSDVEFNSIEPEIQALMLDERFSKEPHIQKRFVNSLRKKVKESYLGNLIVRSNFQPMISDPYAQCEHLFSLDVGGLLQENENYCKFWNEKNVNVVGTARSPLTHSSEFHEASLVDGYMLKDWFGYIDNGFVLNVHGFETLIFADSDKQHCSFTQ